MEHFTQRVCDVIEKLILQLFTDHVQHSHNPAHRDKKRCITQQEHNAAQTHAETHGPGERSHSFRGAGLSLQPWNLRRNVLWTCFVFPKMSGLAPLVLNIVKFAFYIPHLSFSRSGELNHPSLVHRLRVKNCELYDSVPVCVCVCVCVCVRARHDAVAPPPVSSLHVQVRVSVLLDAVDDSLHEVGVVQPVAPHGPRHVEPEAALGAGCSDRRTHRRHVLVVITWGTNIHLCPTMNLSPVEMGRHQTFLTQCLLISTHRLIFQVN